MAKKHGRTGAAQGSTGVGQERKNNPSVHEEDEEEEFSFNTGNAVIEGLHESSGSDADEDDSDESGEADEEGDSDDDASDHNESAEVTKAIAEYYKAARDDDDDDEEEEEGAAVDVVEARNVGDGIVEDDGTDSSEDERPSRNTIGNVPLKWYKHEDHIGYDRDGSKIVKKGQRDLLDEHLAKQDGGKAWRTIYDEYNDEEVVLSKDEIQMIQRIRAGKFPHLEVDPFPEYNDYFSGDVQIHPVLNLPEPKRRFVRSKWEEKKIVKLVRAMRKGWLKRQTQEDKDKEEEPPMYLMWEDDNQVTEKTAVGLTYIPPPKPQLPGHEQSYNPPQEYLPNDEEKRQWEAEDEEDRVTFLPRQYDSLRKVPMYEDFIKERFERCLDLYLCPRSRKKRINIDPESLVPKLPKPADLQPFPMTMCLEYIGHSAKVTSLSPEPSGQWLASGSADGTVKLWEVSTGRCCATWDLQGSVSSVSWCPNRAMPLVSAVAGTTLYLLPAEKYLHVPAGAKDGSGTFQEIRDAVKATAGGAADDDSHVAASLVQWMLHKESGGIQVVHKFPLQAVTWHQQGDYFATVAPGGNTQAVIVHQLSKQSSQNPFRKNRGRVQQVKFHPSKPFFFVATSNHVRVYNLAKQALAKKLIGGSGVITCIDIHPGGDNLIVGCADNRLLWFDMDLSTKPYRSLKYHSKAVRGAAYHRSYPLFATSSDDGTVQVFHGMVYSDLMTNPLLVPVTILRGHEVVDFQGVLDCKYHPTQPWLFTAGADHTVKLWCN